MIVFREHNPLRRNITRDVSSYGDHRADLKLDFKDRCGYCNDIDIWRFMWFEIDHFIPKKRNKIQFLTIKTETDYSNLVYSCRSCNNAKRNKWPTNIESIPNQNDEGFIDPCDDEYENQFDRDSSGKILFKSDLGEWMYNAMKLYKPQHEIIWNIEQLHLLITDLRQLLIKLPNEDTLKDRLILSYNEYDDYLKELFK